MSAENANPSGVLRAARAAALFACALALSACTPQQALLASLIPQGTFSTVLGNFENVSDDNYRRMVEYERRGDWKGLAAFAEANIAKDRFTPDWRLILGYARTQLGEHRAAAEAYSEATRIEPDNATAWNLLAQSYRAAGESHRAVNVLNGAVLYLRDPSRTYYLLGESYGDLGRDAEAAASYRAAVKTDPKFAPAWFSLARASQKLGRTADALEAQAQVEKLDPKLAQRLRAGS